MAITFNKRENEKKRQKKKQDKQKKKDERKVAGKSSFDDMIAYVDENGNITSTPPELQNRNKIDKEDIQISTPKKVEEEIVPQKGRVEYFNAQKGYGFIKNLIGKDKYFFHISNAPQSITEGKLVLFEVREEKGGLNAVNISFV